MVALGAVREPLELAKHVARDLGRASGQSTNILEDTGGLYGDVGVSIRRLSRGGWVR